MKNTIILSIVFFMMTAFTNAPNGYNVGDKAIDFKLKNIDGQMLSLADYAEAKGFMVIFTCNHCPFAIKYQERIIALNKKYASLGYPVIAINPNDVSIEPDDSYVNMQKRAKKMKFTFPYLIDETQEIAKTYGATKTPHVFILQKENDDLIVKYIGAIDDNADDATAVTQKYAEDAVDALLAGKPVTTTFTKALGCGIKWKQ